jgi:hypothetical protein
MREVTLRRDSELIATVREVHGDRFLDRELHPAETDFTSNATEEDREIIVRTVTAQHTLHRKGKLIPMVPGTAPHFDMLPGIFVRLGYEAELLGNEAKTAK